MTSENIEQFMLTPIEKETIQTLMPFASSWIQVDRVLECEPPKFIRTQKYINGLDPIVMGHFLGGPALLPGVLLVEYVSQSAYLLGRIASSGTNSTPPARLLARCSASFVSPARAGDLLTADVRFMDCVRDVVVYEGTVFCGERVICRAKIFAAPVPQAASNNASDCDNASQTVEKAL